jgi:hypothetical protein
MLHSLGRVLPATLLLCSVSAFAQAKRPAAPLPAGPAPNAAAQPANGPKNHPELKAYGSCQFPDGLQVTGVEPMPDDVHERPVQIHGVTKSVPLLDGRRITFAYPGEQPYASVKLELLPAADWIENRKLLLADFDDIVASDKNVTRSNSHAPLSGFSVNGLDRTNLTSGTTLGIYMLMDDRTHTVLTAYFLNPSAKKFKSPEEYGRMRDTFLYNYTHCIRSNQNATLFGNSK